MLCTDRHRAFFFLVLPPRHCQISFVKYRFIAVRLSYMTLILYNKIRFYGIHDNS